MNQSLSVIFAVASHRSAGTVSAAHAIAKELLQQAVLHAVFESPLQQRLVLRGGAALRLCHGNTRYCDDLDFAIVGNGSGGPGMTADDLAALDEVLTSIQQRFGSELTIASLRAAPAQSDDSLPFDVDRWSAVIIFTSPLDGTRQRFAVNVSGFPAAEADVAAVRSPFNLGGNMPILLNVVSREEALCDLLVSLGVSPRVEASDIWDLQFLLRSKVTFDRSLTFRKVLAQAGDRADDAWADFLAKLERCVAEIKEAAFADVYREKMRRFFDDKLAAVVVNDARTALATLLAVAAYIERALRQMREFPGVSR